MFCAIFSNSRWWPSWNAKIQPDIPCGSGEVDFVIFAILVSPVVLKKKLFEQFVFYC